ncbi:hypothetical protein PAPYR_9976 [Paratrimastix pyriformis]|uniref:Uncharacterized protein n=1 Tax=Paratrimastix pyriformis TaxID=342808 RepID=A0ABQ8U732_9EUKA|nr:hypothetical protein PAPYR_9976 [Paratrimastix pyriformis]
MTPRPLFHPSFIPTHLFNLSTINFQLAWHASPSKSPQADIITCIHNILACLPFQTSLSQGDCRNSKESTRQTATRAIFTQTVSIKEASPSHLSRSSMPPMPPTCSAFPSPRSSIPSFEVVPFGVFLHYGEVCLPHFSQVVSTLSLATPGVTIPRASRRRGSAAPSSLASAGTAAEVKGVLV